MTKKFDVCMIGLGPVGAISGVCFAKQGFKVVGVDVNPARVSTFTEGKAPFVEPGVDELVAEVVGNGNFSATLDFADAVKNSRIVMIAVGTPTPEDSGKPDLSFLDNVSRSIGEAIKGEKNTGTIVVVRSTVPPGTMRGRMAKLIEEASGLKVGEDFFIASNPEFLREGKAIEDFFNTGRVVIGADQDHVAASIEGLYKDVVGLRIRTTIETAEFAKYVDNTWHAIKVAYANEIGRVCKAFGGDVDQTTKIFLADDHLNISTYYLRPGFAFGGSCLPKDVRGLTHLANTLGVDVPLVKGILPSNEEQIDQGTTAILNTGARQVGILGVAFKSGVDDLRESPSLAVASRLKKAGVAVIAEDPAYTKGEQLSLPRSTEKLTMTTVEEILASCQTVALLHNTKEYRAIAEECTKKGIAVVDLTQVVQVTSEDIASVLRSVAA